MTKFIKVANSGHLITVNIKGSAGIVSTLGRRHLLK